MTQRGEPTQAGRLARLGFSDTPAVAEAVAQHPMLAAQVDSVRAAADPDAAVLALARILSTGAVDAASWESQQWRRLAMLLGGSAALGDHLARHPSHCNYVVTAQSPPAAEQLQAAMLAAVAGRPWLEALDGLRVAYRREVCAIAALDLEAGEHSVSLLPAVTHALSDLADAVIAAALDLAMREVPAASATGLAVIAMGKCGARELNYVSDVDVVFVARTADEAATAVAQLVMRACSEPTAQGAIWEVDAALRPEGKAGPLVRTLPSFIEYYQRWAQPWEFQALLKARYVAGDAQLGGEFTESLAEYVWSAAGRDGFVESVQAMRERVTSLLPAKDADRELKLGRGGLRDVEFAVQLLQLVHGRSDTLVRSPNTMLALEQLAMWGYVGREDSAHLVASYGFLRTLEHRIQVSRMRRTHVLPESHEELRRLGRSMGITADPVEELTKQWRRHAREVRRIHEKLFYRPLLTAVARLSGDDARLSLDAARDRLAALGYRDPDGALRHLEALTSGVARRAVIQRTLLPVMLDWFAQAPDPDGGLLGFRRVSEALGETPWYLRLLRDESVTAQRLAQVLGTSRLATDLLLRAPEAVRLLTDDPSLQPRQRDELLAEAAAVAARHEHAADAVAGLRALRRRELFRLGCAELLGLLDAQQAGAALTDLTDAVLDGALQAVVRTFVNPPPFAVIAMGRYGGGELGLGSDADVMFCYDDVTVDAAATAHAIANSLRELLMTPSTDPELIVDADLRPEGRNGPLVRSLDSFAAYYSRWSAGWEAQALLRAQASVGNRALGERFTAMIDPVRYPEFGLPAPALTEIRRLKARMESERLPRGVDPALHLKLGPGGLSDVEWVVQILQMSHGYDYPALRTTRTLPALHVASEAGLVEAEDAAALAQAWQLAMRVRNFAMLVRGRATDALPTDPAELSRLAQAMGYGPRAGQQLREDYLRTTRRCRAVTMRLLYGQAG